jgi:hypothetical protein
MYSSPNVHINVNLVVRNSKGDLLPIKVKAKRVMPSSSSWRVWFPCCVTAAALQGPSLDAGVTGLINCVTITSLGLHLYMPGLAQGHWGLISTQWKSLESRPQLPLILYFHDISSL